MITTDTIDRFGLPYRVIRVDRSECTWSTIDCLGPGEPTGEPMITVVSGETRDALEAEIMAQKERNYSLRIEVDENIEIGGHCLYQATSQRSRDAEVLEAALCITQTRLAERPHPSFTATLALLSTGSPEAIVRARQILGR